MDLARLTSDEGLWSITKKVLDGKQATAEERRSLAAAALERHGEKEEISSLAAKVASGRHEPTADEIKSLAASVRVQEFLIAIDTLRTLVADDNLLSRTHKKRIIKYLDAIETITRQYKPDHEPDREVLLALVGTLKKYVVRLTRKAGENLAIGRIFEILDRATDLLPI
jgi:hypothetical protein